VSAGQPGVSTEREGEPPVDPEVAVTGRSPVPRWAVPVFLLAAAALLPWIVWLSLTLPRRAEARHYRLAWVGFDVGMVFLLGILGWLARKRSPRVELAAAAATTYLLIDAWFDVVTAASDKDLLGAAAAAVILELPLAAMCGWVALHAEQVRREGIRELWRHAQRASTPPRLRYRRRRPDGPPG